MSAVTRATGPFSDLRILGLQADESACGHYRVAYPIEFLKRGGAQVATCKEFDITSLIPYDYIIAQRQHAPTVYKLLKHAMWAKRTVMFEIDDDVHRIHRTSPVFNIYKPGGETLQEMDRFMKSCNGMITSSPELASHYQQMNQRIWTIPNYIDIGVRDWDSPVERHPDLQGFVVIGWAGSITHQDDWEPMKGVLARVLNKYDHVRFAIVSAYSTMELFCKNLELPEEKVVRLEPQKFNDYPPLLGQFDIGVCPLINTPFNRAKSDLKIKEYGARGVPYVATNIAPYLRFHMETQGQGGYLASAPSEWEEALCKLVEDEADRVSKAAYIQDTIRSEYSYASNVWRWAQALRECRDMSIYQPEVERKVVVHEKPGRNDPCPCGSSSKYKRCCSPAWG